MLIKVQDDILYHIFERNDRFFLVDSYNQLFWDIGSNLNKESTIVKLSALGFFLNKQDDSDQNYNKEQILNHLVINPSTECNLDCWYCYSKDYRKTNQKKLGFKEVKKVIEIVLEHKRKKGQDLRFSLSLGYSQEITLDFQLFKDVKEYIDTLNKNSETEIHLFLPSTNLMQVGTDFVDYINQYKFLVVSLDIDNNIQKQKVLQNLTLFSPSVVKQLIIPISAETPPLLSLYTDYSKFFDSVSIRPVRVGNDSKIPWNNNRIKIFNDRITEFFDSLLVLEGEELLHILRLIGPTDYIGRSIDRIIQRTKIIERCPAGKTAFVLSTDLKLYPCSGLMGVQDFEIGHVNLEKNVMFLENTKILQNKVIDDCSRCSIHYYCGGPCVDWVFKQYGVSENRINSFECRINKHLFEEAINFIFHLKIKKPEILNKYVEKKGLRNKLNYSLNFDDFCNQFAIKVTSQ